MRALLGRTTFPSVPCARSRKNVLSQGLTLIQVRGFQLPALGPSCKSCGGSFCRAFCKTTAPSAVASDRASGPGLRAPTRTPRTRRGAECMKIVAAVFVHLCCRTRRAAMEGGSEKGGKVSCASPPPRQSKGETSQPKGGKRGTEPNRAPCTTPVGAARRLHRCSSAAVRAFLKLDGFNEGRLHFLLQIFPSAQFLVRRCWSRACARTLARSVRDVEHGAP